MFLPSKHLLSAFYETLPSKNPSKSLVFTENPLQAPSKNPSKKALAVREPSKNPSKSRVRLHGPLVVCTLEMEWPRFGSVTARACNGLSGSGSLGSNASSEDTGSQRFSRV